VHAAQYSAAAFVDSVGVNTHLSSEPYRSRFSLLSELLRSCGIRHLRDELRPDNKLNQWRELFNRYGIRSHLLVSPETNSVPQMLRYLSALGVEKVSAIEGQNEGDAPAFVQNRASRGDWSATVVSYQREVHEALRARYPAERLPILSPTVLDWKPDDIDLIRGAANFCDVVAIHSYVQDSQEPETTESDASLSWYLRHMRDNFKPGAPVMATETGYNNLVGRDRKGISEHAAAIYLPRLLLYNFAAGIQRTFLYELMDGGPDPQEWEHHWGLVRYDGTPKPAFHAIARLLNALSDEGSAPRKEGPAFAASLLGGPEDAKLLAFSKADGSTVLAIWRPAPCWDRLNKSGIIVAPEPATLVIRPPAAQTASMSLEGGNTWRELPVLREGIQLPVGPQVLLVRLSGHGASGGARY
jgi:hypothetical protein